MKECIPERRIQQVVAWRSESSKMCEARPDCRAYEREKKENESQNLNLFLQCLQDPLDKE